MYMSKNPYEFTQKEIAVALQIWNRAAISLLDIRHNLISPGEALRGYRLPASTFLFTSGGKADITMNDTAYNVECFGLFHGGKGTVLDVQPKSDWLEYYMVLYKAAEPPFRKGEYAKLMEQVNPFRQQYGFAPHNPLFFSEELRKIYEKWKGPTPLNLFYGKAAFYCCVHEVYEELTQGRIHVFEPDIVLMARGFLDKHYRESVSINELCGMLGVSYSHFHRSFKQQTGKSPQEYLIGTRLNAAMKFLQSSPASIREIADYCGFQDERNLQRMFSKKLGMTPNVFRENTSYHMRDDVLGNATPFPYNGESQVRLGELKGKGATFMLKQMRSKAVVAAALSLMLLMSACGTVPADTSGATNALSAAITSQMQEQGATRIVSTPNGDVEVPEKPQRVIAQYIMGDLASLGLMPIGISDMYDGAAFSDVFSDVTNLGHQAEWDPESIMELEPDLILVINEGDVAKFSSIAPTVYIPQGEMNQKERVTLIGELLNRQKEAEAAINAYNTNLAAAKNKLSEAGFDDYTVSVFEGGMEGMTVIGGKYNVGVTVYTALGLNAPEAVQRDIIDQDTYSEMVSFEVLPKYSGDYIFLNVYEGMDDLSQSDVWNSLPAVKNNHVIEIEFGFSYYSDLYSAAAQVDYVTEALLNLAANQ